MPQMRGQQIIITTAAGQATLDEKIAGIEAAGATDWDTDDDGRVDKAYALSTPPLDPRPITWTVTDLDRELRRLANRSVGIAAAL